jgi:hypothetical protein
MRRNAVLSKRVALLKCGFAAYVHVTAVGGDATITCRIKSASLWPAWEHKAASQSSSFEIVHSGRKNSPSQHPMNLEVKVVTNDDGNFSQLTIRNATRQFAGKYKCIEGTITWTESNEAEIVILGEFIFAKV